MLVLLSYKKGGSGSRARWKGRTFVAKEVELKVVSYCTRSTHYHLIFYINKNEREGKFYETKQKEILAGECWCSYGYGTDE